MLKLLALRPLLTAAAAFSSSGEKWRTESADETCPTVEKKRAIEEIPLKKKPKEFVEEIDFTGPLRGPLAVSFLFY